MVRAAADLDEDALRLRPAPAGRACAVGADEGVGKHAELERERPFLAHHALDLVPRARAVGGVHLLEPAVRSRERIVLVGVEELAHGRRRDDV